MSDVAEDHDHHGDEFDGLEKRREKLEKLARDQAARIAELTGEVRDALTAAEAHAREHHELRKKLDQIHNIASDNPSVS